MGREQYETFVNHTSLRWINHSMIIADLLKCLETLTPRPEAAPTMEVKIFDGLLLFMS